MFAIPWELSYTDSLYSWKIILLISKNVDRAKWQTKVMNLCILSVSNLPYVTAALLMADEWQWHSTVEPARAAAYSTIVRLHLEGPMPSCSSGPGLTLPLCANQPTSFLRVLVASLAVPSFLMSPGVAQACCPYASEGFSLSLFCKWVVSCFGPRRRTHHWCFPLRAL